VAKKKDIAWEALLDMNATEVGVLLLASSRSYRAIGRKENDAASLLVSRGLLECHPKHSDIVRRTEPGDRAIFDLIESFGYSREDTR